ncbi:enterotoxin A family protein [Pseudomonas chlororaphis]|uniref:enterotoxin A family protein n=2 Tax=Pseudomonas chlororaphis TaxID=587753 RepID=UPI001F15262A|nr:enterotoxin A family protein [Pseudomonas chlororaphis]
MADSITAAAAVTANVEAGLAITAGAASAATGIASGATEKNNPEVSQKLKWASLGLGVGSAVFGAGAGVAKVRKGLQGLSKRLGRVQEEGLSGRGAIAAGREMAAERNSPLRLRGGGNETVLYRGDTRSPDAIKSAGGFTSKSGKSSPGVLQEYYEKLRTSPDGVARDHVAFKNKDFISTAVDEQCGGYSSGYIYKIEISNFSVHKFGPDVLGAGAKSLRSGRIFPHLMMSGETYYGSELVAIQQPLQSNSPEVSFLTSIPDRYIASWRKGNSNEWNAF